VDVTSISVPTGYHHDVATSAMERDVSVLVEKPFVTDAEKGRELIRMARDRDLTLQVGHIERFNPVVDVPRRPDPRPGRHRRRRPSAGPAGRPRRQRRLS